MEHIEMKNSSESKLQIDSTCSIGILSISAKIKHFSLAKVQRSKSRSGLHLRAPSVYESNVTKSLYI